MRRCVCTIVLRACCERLWLSPCDLHCPCFPPVAWLCDSESRVGLDHVVSAVLHCTVRSAFIPGRVQLCAEHRWHAPSRHGACSARASSPELSFRIRANCQPLLFAVTAPILCHRSLYTASPPLCCLLPPRCARFQYLPLVSPGVQLLLCRSRCLDSFGSLFAGVLARHPRGGHVVWVDGQGHTGWYDCAPISVLLRLASCLCASLHLSVLPAWTLLLS